MKDELNNQTMKHYYVFQFNCNNAAIKVQIHATSLTEAKNQLSNFIQTIGSCEYKYLGQKVNAKNKLGD
jgi:hypothetical protein